MGAGVRDAFPPPICVVWLYSFICAWKRRCADVRAGTQAPPLRILLEKVARRCPPLRFRLGRLRVGRLISFGWIAWTNMMEMGRGGACVPARVALQGRIHRSIPRV